MRMRPKLTDAIRNIQCKALQKSIDMDSLKYLAKPKVAKVLFTRKGVWVFLETEPRA